MHVNHTNSEFGQLQPNLRVLLFFHFNELNMFHFDMLSYVYFWFVVRFIRLVLNKIIEILGHVIKWIITIYQELNRVLIKWNEKIIGQLWKYCSHVSSGPLPHILVSILILLKWFLFYGGNIFRTCTQILMKMKVCELQLRLVLLAYMWQICECIFSVG